MKKIKKVKAWAVVKKKNGKLERFSAEGMAVHHIIYPKKQYVNEQFHQIVPVIITFAPIKKPNPKRNQPSIKRKP